MAAKTYHIITYGCDANRADSEKIAWLLEHCGFKKTPAKEKAGLLIFNTCSVRQKAEDRVFGRNKEMKTLKEKNPGLKIVLAGCMNHYDKKFLKERLPFVDIFLPIKELPSLPAKLNLKHKSAASRHIQSSRQSNFRAYVPISQGCDNFCSYCIVPFSRGREYSRPAKEIINEVCKLVNNGYKEIWLLGQNVNSYRGGISFAELLLKINEIPGKFWIRFASPHPKDFSDALIKAMKKAEKFPKYINLPVQSGNNQILKKMNRPYTVFQYKSLVKKIRKAMPEISISTDVIVGFPGETKKQFQDTVRLFKEIKFDMAFISEYSPRPKTAAAIAFKDNVPPAEKDRRKKALNEVLIKTALLNNKKLVGKTVEVLIDKKSGGRVFGKTEGNKNIEIEGKGIKKLKLGDFAAVKVANAAPWHLKGKIV